MTIKSGFFNSVNGDRKYDARWFAEYFASFIGNGVFPNPSNSLQVVEGTNMTTIVKAGKGWINGYFVVNDSDYTLQHDIADGVLKRIDRVVMRLNYLTRQIEIDVKKGTSASNPVAPTLQRDTDYVELALADVLISNGATAITQANITDTRLNNTLCGIVHGTVDQVDTTTIFNQYQAWFNSVKDGTEQEIEQWQQQQYADFQAWFESIQDILDGDVAANLAQRIATLENGFSTLNDSFVAHVGENAVSAHKASNISVVNPETSEATDMQTFAELLFTNGNNVKSNTVDALLSVDKNLPITSTSPWHEIISSISGISAGMKSATGTIVRANGGLTIAGLDFEPLIALITAEADSDYRAELIVAINANSPKNPLQLKAYNVSTVYGFNVRENIQGLASQIFKTTPPTFNEDNVFVPTSFTSGTLKYNWLVLGV